MLLSSCFCDCRSRSPVDAVPVKTKTEKHHKQPKQPKQQKQAASASTPDEIRAVRIQKVIRLCWSASFGGPVPFRSPPHAYMNMRTDLLPHAQVEELRKGGQEPYAYRFDRTHYTTELQVWALVLQCKVVPAAASHAEHGKHFVMHLLSRVPFCVQEKYKELANGSVADDGVRVAVAGRVMAKRVMGKLAFLSLRDDKGQIQVCSCKG